MFKDIWKQSRVYYISVTPVSCKILKSNGFNFDWLKKKTTYLLIKDITIMTIMMIISNIFLTITIVIYERVSKLNLWRQNESRTVMIYVPRTGWPRRRCWFYGAACRSLLGSFSGLQYCSTSDESCLFYFCNTILLNETPTLKSPYKNIFNFMRKGNIVCLLYIIIRWFNLAYRKSRYWNSSKILFMAVETI